MSATAYAIEPKIGGLPASRFEGRRIKAMLPDAIFATVICRGSHKKSILVDAVIQGRLRQHHVSPANVKPNWVENDDLQQEAIALGLSFDGVVNVGRALEVARVEEELRKAPKSHSAPASSQPPPEVAPPVPEVAPPVAEEEVAAPDPVARLNAITGVQASITADPSWMSDFADLQTLIASSRERGDRLTALRIELQELESREGEDDDLIELYVDTLKQKGVVVQRGAPAPTRPPSAAPVSSFVRRLSDWLATAKPEQFTFEQACAATGVVDNGARRGLIRSAAVGYVVIPSKRGQPLVFTREFPGA